MKKIYQVDEKVPASLFLPLSLQHTFAMFGASVLVPIIFQIDPGIVLLMNGVGTLLFILIGKGKGSGLPRFQLRVFRAGRFDYL
nr:solute carrier family 23 protein [Treponema vincentii]